MAHPRIDPFRDRRAHPPEHGGALVDALLRSDPGRRASATFGRSITGPTWFPSVSASYSRKRRSTGPAAGWPEAFANQIDAYRRGLQRSYIELMAAKINSRTPVTGDARALVRAELQSLSQEIAAAAAKATDRTTRAHLADSRDQIAKALDPKFAPAAPATAAGPGGRGLDDDNDPSQQSCWPDYIIRPPR